MNKTNKIIIGIAIAAIILVGVIWIARPNQQNNTASLPSTFSGPLIAEENSFDFGTISMAAGKVNHAFKIKNSGAEAVTISKIYTSCMCTAATLVTKEGRFGPYGMVGHGFVPKVNRDLAPSEEASVEVEFDPAAHGPAGIGRIERTVYIENSSGDMQKLEIAVTVTP